MTHHTCGGPLSTLVSVPRLWDRPDDTTSAREYWHIVASIAARALHKLAAAAVSAHSSKTEPDFAPADLLCEVIAEDLRPQPNLIAADVHDLLLLLAAAFGLRPGPETPATTAAPAIADCYQAISLALDGLIPGAYVDQFYDILGGRCPRCAARARGHRPARSRADETQMICSACAIHEATLGTHAPGPDAWPVDALPTLPDPRAELEKHR